MARRRKFSRLHFNAFLEQVQSNVGGYYKTLGGMPVEFIRPLRYQYVRVQNMLTKDKFNIDYRDLRPMNELEVLGYVSLEEDTDE